MTTALQSPTVIEMHPIFLVLMLMPMAIGSLINSQAASDVRCCAVIELRQYTLKPGQRDVLIELFDRYFVEAQESTGMTIIGQFRDLRRPERFVWLRGFPDMTRRHQSLEEFYGGPIWAAHKGAANPTMVDVSDVLLLKPARPESAFRLSPGARTIANPSGSRTVLAGIYQMPEAVSSAAVSLFERDVVPVLASNGVRVEGVFVTEPARNTFTRLPVREGENVLVWFGVAERAQQPEGWLDKLAAATLLHDRRMSVLELEPTARSILGDGPRAARGTKHDFDFLFGSWKIHNRYLKKRLQHSSEWIEFDARAETQPVLNGLGNVDRYLATRDGKQVEGVNLRLFDPATGDWSIHWADTVLPGTLLPPMIGRFTGDVGEFFGDEFVDGRRVRCRFLWTRTNPDSPRWEQAFSDDGGKTWETNWIMNFSREI
jgi:NIPSNAP protein